MTLRITTLVVVLALALGGVALASARPTGAPVETEAASESEAIAAAKTAAKAWLALLDARDFTRTWEEAGEMLKAAADLRRWQRRMSVTLGPLGEVKARAVRSSEYSTRLPAAPDGEYVVIKYDTTFENGQTAMEEVVMMKESDGSWKVAGYRIK